MKISLLHKLIAMCNKKTALVLKTTLPLTTMCKVGNARSNYLNNNKMLMILRSGKF